MASGGLHAGHPGHGSRSGLHVGNSGSHQHRYVFSRICRGRDLNHGDHWNGLVDRRHVVKRCTYVHRWGSTAVFVKSILDHLEGQEVLTLLAQHPAQTLDIVLIELAVAGWGPLRVDQALAFQESDLRNCDVGEFLAEQGEDIADRQVGPGAHSAAPRR